jgi:hypothetical protein
MLLYSTVCTICIMTIPRCPDRIHRDFTFVRFANSTLITSFLKLPFLLSSFPSQLLALPLSHSLSFLVSLSIVVSSFLLIVVFLSFVIAPADEFGDRFFSYCRCVTTVSYACTVRAAWYGSFRAPVVQYRLYHGYCRCITTVWYVCTGCIVR